MAGTTGLEPATSDVTGRRSNQLNYVPANTYFLSITHHARLQTMRLHIRTLVVPVIVVAALSGAWIAGAQVQNSPNFTGGTVTKMEDTSKAVIVKFKFDPGARTRWHSHSGGQIVMVEEGVARHQIKGQPVTEMKAGDTIYVGPGVVHWHGSSPAAGGTQFNITRGDVTWLDPVSDAEYSAPAKK